MTDINLLLIIILGLGMTYCLGYAFGFYGNGDDKDHEVDKP